MVGTLLTPESQALSPAVLVLHGFRGNRNERHIAAVADALAQASFISLRVDLTDNLGDSEGDFRDLTVSQELADAQDALDYLTRHPRVDPLRVGITGHSLGGMVAALTAARTSSVQVVVTLSAVFDMAERLKHLLGPQKILDWQRRGFDEIDPPGSGVFLNYRFYENLLQHDVAAEVSRITSPTLTLHGELDTGVTVRDAQLYHQHVAAPSKDLVLIQGADHVYSSDSHLAQVCKHTVDWFRRYSIPRRTA